MNESTKKSATTVTWKMFALFLCRIAINYTYQQQFCSSHKHIIHLWASQALPPAANASRYSWNIPSILSLIFFNMKWWWWWEITCVSCLSTFGAVNFTTYSRNYSLLSSSMMKINIFSLNAAAKMPFEIKIIKKIILMYFEVRNLIRNLLRRCGSKKTFFL